MSMFYVNRRKSLQLLGGAAILLSPLARARQGLAAGSAKRLIVIYTPNGTHYPLWWPSGTETDFTLNTFHKPLEAYKELMLIFKGLYIDDPGTAAHQQGVAHFLTNAPTPDVERLLPVQSASVDQLIAARIGMNTAFSSLELGMHMGHSLFSTISYNPGQFRQAESDLARAFDRVFGGFTPGTDAAAREAAERRRSERRSVLDYLVGEINSLKQELTGEEKIKLETHLESVRAIERRLDGTTSCVATPTRPQAGELYRASHIDGQVDLITPILACDRTRIITMLWAPEGQTGGYWDGAEFSEGSDHHSASHFERVNSTRMLEEIGLMYSKRVARLVSQLKAIPEGAGSVMDNTVILWGSGIGSGNHEMTNIPFVLIGRCGGYFKTGRFLNYSGWNHSALLLSLADAMGVPLPGIGNPATTHTQVLPGLKV